MKSKLAWMLTLLAATMFTQVAVAQSYTLLHSFSGPDGGSPSGLIQTADGTFYGAAALGGDVIACDPDGCGTLYKIDKAGNFTVLHVFHATDGYHPSGLVKATVIAEPELYLRLAAVHLTIATMMPAATPTM
jgi:uncharacterized repeat protein (TIGR03803 family)